MTIDLNADMGESFGAWKIGRDAELMDFVTSVNVACGFHAGDPSTIRETVELAAVKGLRVGAHPSYPDLQGFGRRAMKLTASEVFAIVLYQTAALKGVCEAAGTRLTHVKPHGALYNAAATDAEIASAIASAVAKLDKTLVFVGLSGSFLISEAEKLGLKTMSEVFADRTYAPDGTLTPRSHPNALITDESLALAQVRMMIDEGAVLATDGTRIELKAETICIHGDGERAVEFAKLVRSVVG